MLAAALATLDAEGVSVALDQVSMERAITASGVSRASAYRRWPTRADFLTDVLAQAVSRTDLVPETEEDVGVLLTLLADRLPEVRTEQGRRDLIVEGLRLAADRDVRRLLASAAWSNHLALAATHRSLPAGTLKTSVGRALVAAERRFTARRADVLAHLPAVLGYRLVPPWSGSEGYRVLSSASGAMMTGILIRAHADPTWLDERTDLRPFGSSRVAAWSEPELHLAGVFLSHLEPDPGIVWDPARIVESIAGLSARVDAARAAQRDGA